MIVLRRRRTGIPDAGRSEVVHGLAVGAVCVVLLVVVALVLLISHLRHVLAPSPPDPAPFARSSTARQADAATTHWMDAQFRALARLAPWLKPDGRSVLDVCSVVGSSRGMFDSGSGFGVSCPRTDARYFAYGGPSAARIRQLEKALRHLGWGNYAPVMAVTQSRLPAVQAGTFNVSAPVTKPGLEFSWANRASQLSLQQDLGAVGPRAAPQRNFYLETRAPSLSSVLGGLTPSRPHVLIVAITVIYAHKGPLQVA